MHHTSMNFTCNPVKNETNIRERGLPLLAARVMFNPAMRVREDARKVYSERRFIGYNMVAGRLMVVVFCTRRRRPCPYHFFQKGE